jgi:hypothetical protein
VQEQEIFIRKTKIIASENMALVTIPWHRIWRARNRTLRIRPHQCNNLAISLVQKIRQAKYNLSSWLRIYAEDTIGGALDRTASLFGDHVALDAPVAVLVEGAEVAGVEPTVLEMVAPSCTWRVTTSCYLAHALGGGVPVKTVWEKFDPRGSWPTHRGATPGNCAGKFFLSPMAIDFAQWGSAKPSFVLMERTGARFLIHPQLNEVCPKPVD